ncbi:MAG: toll/interleukin-1 receptor domain-containing protein [Rhodospirillales bacterium]
MYENSRYQIAILDPQGCGLHATLERTLIREAAELGLDPQRALDFLGPDNVDARSTRDPIVGVYRGGRLQNDACTQALQTLRDAGADILPLVDDLKTYPQSVPSVLHPINGLQLDPGDAELRVPASRIFEMLRLMRSQRRLFISYRRTQSREVAVQLYYLLQERRFDVFLDTHGVQTGDAFQEELGQRLLDADVMIFLDTSGATASEWVRKEIEIANALAIGVLQVIFPRPPAPDGRLDRARFTELCEPLELGEAEFAGSDLQREGGEPLKDDVLTRIALRVEGLRARSTAARRARLTSRLLAALTDKTLRSPPRYEVEPGRYVTVHRSSGDCRVFPQIGVVDSPCLHRAEMDAEKLPVAVLYDPTGLRDESQRHLDWLCRYAKIAPISLLNTEQWVSAG